MSCPGTFLNLMKLERTKKLLTKYLVIEGQLMRPVLLLQIRGGNSMKSIKYTKKFLESGFGNL